MCISNCGLYKTTTFSSTLTLYCYLHCTILTRIHDWKRGWSNQIMHFIFWCIFLPFLFFSSTRTRSKISSHWDALTKSYITVFTLSFSFLFLGSNETETHIYMLKNSNIKPELLTRYASKFFSLYVCYRFWEFALGIDQLNYHYYAIYDKLKGYGINKEVIESEGVYGIFILIIYDHL